MRRILIRLGGTRSGASACLVTRAVTRAVVLAVVLVGTTLVAVPSASAVSTAVNTATTGGTIVDGVPEAIVIVTDERTLVRWTSTSSGGPRWVCGYHPIVAPMHSVYDPSPVVDWSTRVAPETGRDYMLGCFVDDGAGGRTLVRSRYVVYDSTDVFSGLASTERAMDEARRRLDLPMPDPSVNPPGEQLVGLPMWMWLERPWERRSAVAAIGDTWAAVSAIPVLSRWSFADGSVLWCDQGVRYDLDRSPRDQSSGCTHTFQHSSRWSAGGVEWVEVTMIWKVEWYASDVPGQPLGTVERSVSFPVRVVEAQAVVR